VRLLLDEHFSARIAEQLRERGHDVIATQGDLELEGADDESLLARAVAERRALLTNNVRDFVRIVHEWAEAGRDHYGVLLTSDKSMPRDREAIGRYIDALDKLLIANPADDALVNRVLWLKPSGPGP
jgi:hypothetical protein